mgnify:FL=1
MYFEDFGICQDFTQELVKVATADAHVQEQVLIQSLATLRCQLVQSLRDTKPLLINLGMLGPNFNDVYTHPVIFPASQIFDFENMQSKRFYRSLINITKSSSDTNGQ